ncbi:hypothetical protein [Thalassomonas sp. M1454]|uniref:hypothetical protein n=1 Tax=Thalassomonas sp. M1454 TaxID=2594477 RepID=UPI00163D67AD|nr:hypothetical protein [Thalassomonas sp. M1454]
MKVIVIFCILVLFVLLKFSAPELVSIMPEWLNGLIIILVLVGLLVSFIKRLSKGSKD